MKNIPLQAGFLRDNIIILKSMNKESPNIQLTMCPCFIHFSLPRNKKYESFHIIHLRLIKLYAPNINILAGKKSNTNKCMCWDATSLLNLFKDSLPVFIMPENGDWRWPILTDTMDLPTTMLVSTRRGNTRGHHTLRLFSRIDLRIWLSSWRITLLTVFK